MIEKLRIQLDNGEITSDGLFEKARSRAMDSQKDINAFITILDKKEEKKSASILRGIPYALKDNFSTSGIKTTGGSNILSNYIPIYDATVYKKLKEAGAVLVGKTAMDELAMGGTGTTCYTGITRNPLDKTRLIGGSSSGSCASVVADITPFSIGSDTGDSVRKPAAFGGIVGFKPTYGLISRYGLFAFASSLDHVAMFTQNVRDAAIVTNILKGQDPHDMTTLPDDHKDYLINIEKDIKGKKLFYFKDICDINFYQEKNEMLEKTLNSFNKTVSKVKEMGVEIDEVDFPLELLESIYPVYMTISCAEATSNNSNLTGIPFGLRGEGDSYIKMMFDARTRGFSELIKRRFILGSYILQKENQDKLFLNACRIRRMIVERMHDLFQKYDGLIMPASGGIAPHFNEKSDTLSNSYLILENHLAIGNFGGFPSITLKSDEIFGMPIAINITSDIKKDEELLNIANKIYEKLEGSDINV